MLMLEKTFGHLIPDVEFVLSSVDRPLTLASKEVGRPSEPVFRCAALGS
jgi:hypothetical protein